MKTWLSLALALSLLGACTPNVPGSETSNGTASEQNTENASKPDETEQPSEANEAESPAESPAAATLIFNGETLPLMGEAKAGVRSKSVSVSQGTFFPESTLEEGTTAISFALQARTALDANALDLTDVYTIGNLQMATKTNGEISTFSQTSIPPNHPDYKWEAKAENGKIVGFIEKIEGEPTFKYSFNLSY